MRMSLAFSKRWQVARPNRYGLPILFAALAWSGSLAVVGQVPIKCLEIERVLVDACNSACSGAQEGENEMFRFIVGPQPIALADLSASWATPNSFLGWVQNATTASLTAQLNATITNCGWLLEPPAGLIPAGKRVLGITSTNLCVAGNSFAGLSDTLYVIYQAPGNTFGHFKNNSNGTGITTSPTGASDYRTFILSVLGQCSDTVTYNAALLVNQFGTYGGGSAVNDGASLEVSWPGAPIVTYVNDGCQAPITPFVVTVTTQPPSLPCGGTAALAGTAIGNIASVFWTGGTGTFSGPDSYTTDYTLGVDETSSTTLSFCAVNACGDTLCDAVLLTVAPPDPLTITPSGPTTLCAGNAVQLTVSGGADYTWSTGATTATITVDATGTYSVGSTNACGTVTAEVTVVVNEVPVAAITGPDAACAGAAVQLIASGGTTYAWNTGSTTDTLNATGPGTYTVVAAGSCGTDTATLVVVEAPTLEPTFSTPAQAGCAPFCVTLTATDPTLIYTWTFGDGGVADGADAAHCFVAGSYDVSLTAYAPAGDPRCPGTVSATEYIDAWPTPVADFSITPSVVTLEAPTVNMQDHSSNADDLSWNVADQFTTDAPDFTYTFAEIDCYTVTLNASNSYGCTDRTSREICVEDAFQLWVPNSFTPNNDGINDRFNLVTSVGSPADYVLTIFDRWGRVLFNTENVGEGWSGDGVPDGVYVWKVHLRDTNGKMHDQAGHVVLLR